MTEIIHACPTCGPTATEPHPRLPIDRCSNCKEHITPAPAEARTEGGEAGPTPAGTVDNPDGLRESIAAAILTGLCRRLGEGEWTHAVNDLTDAVLGVRDTELQQLREMYSQQSAANAAYRLQIDELIRRNSEYADRAIANGERAEQTEAAIARVAALAEEHPAGIDTALVLEALDGQAVDDPEKQQLREAIARVHAELISLCREPHPSHDHVCPDDVRRTILAALDDQPTRDR